MTRRFGAAVAVAVMVAVMATAQAASINRVTLVWTLPDRNTDGTACTNLAGIILYHGLTNGVWTDTLRVGVVTAQQWAIEQDATNWWVARAFNTQTNVSEESLPGWWAPAVPKPESEVQRWPIPPGDVAVVLGWGVELDGNLLTNRWATLGASVHSLTEEGGVLSVMVQQWVGWGLMVYQTPAMQPGQRYGVSFQYRSPLPVTVEACNDTHTVVAGMKSLPASTEWRADTFEFTAVDNANRVRFTLTGLGLFEARGWTMRMEP